MNLLKLFSSMIQERPTLRQPAPPPGPPPPISNSATQTEISSEWLEIVVLDNDLRELIQTKYPQMKALLTPSYSHPLPVAEKPSTNQGVLPLKPNPVVQVHQQVAAVEIQSIKSKVLAQAQISLRCF